MSDGAFAAQRGLTCADMALVETSTAATRLGLAAQLKFFQNDGVFPSAWSELGEEVRAWLAEQLGLAPNAGTGYAFEGRTGRRHRADIARHLGLRRLNDAGRATLGGWIARVLCPQALSASAMLEAALRWCRDHSLIAPSRKVIERLVRSERQRFHEGILAEATARLSPETAERLEAVLGEPEAATGFHRLKADVGAATLESVLAATGRLGFIKELALPRDLLAGPARPCIERIARRVGAETATEMRRHPRKRRLAMLALWLMVRESRLDLRGDRSAHRDGAQDRLAGAAQGEPRARARDRARARAEERLLAEIATAAIETPDGAVRAVIFPIASEARLAAVVRAYNERGALDRRIFETMRRSYARHYRRMNRPGFTGGWLVGFRQPC